MALFYLFAMLLLVVSLFLAYPVEENTSTTEAETPATEQAAA